jgi:hypothetical protein
VSRSPVPLCLRCSLSGVPRDSRLSLPLSIWSRYALPSSFTSLLSPLHWLPVLFLRPPVVNRVGLVEVKGLVLLAAGDQWSCGLTGVRSMCMCVCLCMWVHTHIYLHMVSISISGLLSALPSSSSTVTKGHAFWNTLGTRIGTAERFR